MTHLLRASHELFRRTPDETFPSLEVLAKYFQWQREQSREIWQPPRTLRARPVDGQRLLLDAGDDGAYELNDWSFGQSCRLSGVAKETVNRLTPDTAGRVFAETLPQGPKPLQLFTLGGRLRSLHAASYTRLHNADLLEAVPQCRPRLPAAAQRFQWGHRPLRRRTGRVPVPHRSGRLDGIDGEPFVAGFFLWNSEVGCRSVGIETFWYQSIFANHIVWDAVEIVEFSASTRPMCTKLLCEIRLAIQSLVRRRDERRDGFAAAIKTAMQTKLGDDADEVHQILGQIGIARTLAKEAVTIAQQQGRFTIFALVDALTRIAGRMVNAGERSDEF